MHWQKRNGYIFQQHDEVFQIYTKYTQAHTHTHTHTHTQTHTHTHTHSLLHTHATLVLYFLSVCVGADSALLQIGLTLHHIKGRSAALHTHTPRNTHTLPETHTHSQKHTHTARNTHTYLDTVAERTLVAASSVDELHVG